MEISASLSEFYTRPTQLSLVDFLVIGETTYVLDKDANGDFAFIYATGYLTTVSKQSLQVIAPLQIALKSGQSAFFDASLTFLHVEDTYTSTKMYYTSIIFKEDEQPFQYNPNQLSVYSQITYKDQGANIVGKITQNYKLILDTLKNTLQVQNLYTLSYEKFIQFDENVFGLLVDQYTDSFIILFKTHSQRFQIQEPYLLAVPTQISEFKRFSVSGVSSNSVYDAQLTYQVLAQDDYKLYILKTDLVTLDAKFWTDHAITSQPIVTSGPNPFVEYSEGLTTKLTAYAYQTQNIQLDSRTVQGTGIHATKKLPYGYWVLTQLTDLTQNVFLCQNNFVNNCVVQTIQFYKRDTILQYQFSQTGDKMDFGVLFNDGLDLYKNQQFQKTLTTIDRILSYFLTGELLVTKVFQYIVDFSTELESYVIIIFTEDLQQFTYGSQIMPVISSIKYKDNGSIIGKVTQKYKLVLDKSQRTLQVQNLYKLSYEKEMKFDDDVYGLLVDQPNDSFIILFQEYGQRYSIQEPYFQANPNEPTDLQHLKITATSTDGQRRELVLKYQALKKEDQNIYRTIDVSMEINIKFQTNEIILFQNYLPASGPTPSVEFQKCQIAQFEAIYYTKNHILQDEKLIQGIKHIASKFSAKLYILIEIATKTLIFLECQEIVCQVQMDLTAHQHNQIRKQTLEYIPTVYY